MRGRSQRAGSPLFLAARNSIIIQRIVAVHFVKNAACRETLMRRADAPPAPKMETGRRWPSVHAGWSSVQPVQHRNRADPSPYDG